MTTHPIFRSLIEEDLRTKKAEREAVLQSIASRRRYAIETPHPLPGLPDELSLSAERLGELDYGIYVLELAVSALDAAEPEPWEPVMERHEEPLFRFGPDGWKERGKPEDVENFVPSTSPITPFDPSTAIAETPFTPGFSVEEALKDPLGIQLVENIHRRKEPTLENDRTRAIRRTVAELADAHLKALEEDAK